MNSDMTFLRQQGVEAEQHGRGAEGSRGRAAAAEKQDSGWLGCVGRHRREGAGPCASSGRSLASLPAPATPCSCCPVGRRPWPCAPVVVGRAEGVLRHGPAGGKDDKVGDGGARQGRGGGEHREDRWVWVVEADRVDCRQAGRRYRCKQAVQMQVRGGRRADPGCAVASAGQG